MGVGDIFSMFNEIFGGMGGMGGGGGQPRKRRGYDLETQVTLTLEEIATGAEPTIDFDRTDLCETCDGSGAQPGTEVKRCGDCGGYGQVQQQVQGIFGASVRVMACPACEGKGEVVTEPCKACRGSGRSKIHRTLQVQIPAGVRDGQAIRVRGEGEPGDEGAPRGDLHVYITVKPHPLLQRRGDDLICTVPIPYSLAALGGVTPVPTLSGEEEIDIPAGTQNGDVIHMKGRGLPALQSNKMGQQHVVVYIEVPKKLSKSHRELLEQLAEIDRSHVADQQKSFFSKVKDYFAGRDHDDE
jgi:molecular chaperone DnaJ